MPFGTTYAVFATLVGLSIVSFKDSESALEKAPPTGAAMVAAGLNDPRKGGIGRQGLLSVDYYPEGQRLFGLKTFYAAGLGRQGGGFVAHGVRRDFYFGDIRVTPFFGLALHQRDLGEFKPDQLMQFRTGVDVMVPVSDSISVSLGYFHMSNAQVTEGSASVDLTRAGLVYRF